LKDAALRIIDQKNLAISVFVVSCIWVKRAIRILRRYLVGGNVSVRFQDYETAICTNIPRERLELDERPTAWRRSKLNDEWIWRRACGLAKN
jgi:hypothetical protein